jgi:hypothetical protein
LRRALLVAAGALVVAAASRPARGDDYVTLRGAYYRELSTRVIQPTLEVERDDVATGVDVKAHFLVDAITSASVAAGTSVDSIFTETRNEVGLTLRKRWSRAEATLGYKYSAESDYWSHAVGGSLARRLWGDTARLALSFGINRDTVYRPGLTPLCAQAPSTTCWLHGYFLGASYTQVLSPVWLAQVSVESTRLSGAMANFYRAVPNHDYEVLPGTRLRNALSGRLAYYVPRTGTALRLLYRYYFDLRPCDLGGSPCDAGGEPWNVRSHTLEGRVYQPLTRSLDVRLSYRWYYQSHANFWRAPGAMPLDESAAYVSTDPKLGPVTTKYPEVKVFWLADALADVPVLGWLSAGTFDVSYGYFIQSTTFKNAHLLQLGYTMPY